MTPRTREDIKAELERARAAVARRSSLAAELASSAERWEREAAASLSDVERLERDLRDFTPPPLRVDSVARASSLTLEIGREDDGRPYLAFDLASRFQGAFGGAYSSATTREIATYLAREVLELEVPE